MVTYICNNKECKARWTDTGGNNVCPACQSGIGQVDMPKHGETTVETAESQQLHALPSEQVYMRFICRKYIEALEAFQRSLTDEQATPVHSIVEGQVLGTKSFEEALSGFGLPLELPLSRSDGDKAKAIETYLRDAESQLQSARDLFLELFNTPEAVEEIEERFGSGKD